MEPQEDSDARYERGMVYIGKVLGETGEATIAQLADIAPDLGRYIVEFGYGDVYSRPGLELPKRQLVTLGCLVAIGGAETQLEYHIAGARRLGFSRAEIVEAILQTLPFVGFPRTLNAIAVAKRVLAEPGPAPSD